MTFERKSHLRTLVQCCILLSTKDSQEMLDYIETLEMKLMQDEADLGSPDPDTTGAGLAVGGNA